MYERETRVSAAGGAASAHCKQPEIWRVWIIACCLACCCAAPLRGQDSDLFTIMTEHGLRFGDDVQVRLPAPTLTADLSSQAREAALAELAGKQGWENFSRNSVSAPMVIDIDAVSDAAGERLGLLVHHAFAVHAELSQLSDMQAMEEIFGSPAKAQEAAGVVTQELSDEQLREQGFSDQADSTATFAYIELPLLNKILVRGVVRIEKRQRPGAIEFVWRLDPSFDSSDRFASRWTRLERNSVGKLVPGESFKYQGCGGRLGAYEVGAEPKPLLIESHLLLHEPKEWFAGSHFLRSKIPSLVQENARSFRRKLAEQ